jgi:hypothetical protein
MIEQYADDIVLHENILLSTLGKILSEKQNFFLKKEI